MKKVSKDQMAKLERVTTNLQSALAEARDFVEEILNDMEAYAAERSDKWQESEAGQIYEDWKSSWDEALGELESACDVADSTLPNLQGEP